MSRLIDADELNKLIEEDFDGVCVYDVAPSEAVSDFQHIVDLAPAVDAVEVVRCKDCKYSRGGGHYCEILVDYRNPDDYCSRGERKTE